MVIRYMIRLVPAVFILLLAACEKDTDNNETLSDKIDTLNIHTGIEIPGDSLLPHSTRFDKELVITDESLYRNLSDTINYYHSLNSSETLSFPEIDFSENTLLGFYVADSACSADYETNVLKNSTTKYCEFDLSVNYHENSGCTVGYLTRWIWVLVPVLPEDYSVNFVLSRNFNYGI